MRAAYVAVLRSALAGFCHKLLLLVALLGLAGQAMALPATSTVLTLSPASPVIKGQSVALTAVVTGAAPTGSVTFMNGSTSLGSGTLSGGTATLSSTFNTKGTFSITAVYGGDTKNAASTSAAVALNVLPTTTTTLSATPTGTVTTAQSVSLKATISGTSPTGSVTFYDGSTSLGNVSLSSASATLATTFSTPGSHSITAAYSGDASNANSVSSATVISVISVTSNVVSVSANPVSTTQSVTFTDIISGNNPTGTVTFYSSGSSIGTGTVSAGQATLTKPIATVGTYSITATYGGDSNNAASTSAAASITVIKTTTAAVTVSPTSASTGQNVTLHATISSTGTDTGASGTVTFYDGGTTLGSASVASGVTQLVATFASGGVHSISAVYSGDSANAGSTATAVNLPVKGPSSTSLASSVATAGTGKNVILTATVSGTGVVPTGNVTFYDSTTSLGSGTISGGQATLTTTFSSTGSHSLTAVYGGDTYNTTSTSPVDSLTVLNNNTVSVGASANPVLIGQSVTLTTVVGGSTPSGSVTFMDGSTSLGSGTITANSASLATSFSTLGAHSITAIYGGDSKNLGATSSVSTLYVVPLSSTSVVASANPVGISQSVTLTASVSGSPNYGGTVTFYDGSTNLGQAFAQPGLVPTLTTSFSTRGVHNITAVFGGDIYDSVSTSPVLALNVLPASTTTLSGASTNVWGQGYTATVTVSGSSPTGTVNVYFGTDVEFTGELNNGQAILSGPIICCTGSTPSYAVYSGDVNNAPSTSANLTVNISVGTKPTLYLEPLQNVASIGETVVLNAGTHDALSHGSVTFYDGTTVLGTVPYTGDGSTNDVGYGFNFVPTTAGAHALKAVYTGASGDSTSVTATATVQVTSSSGSDVLSASASSVNAGQNVTFTAAVGGNSPSGSVTFMDGGVTLGSVAVSGGQAVYTTSFTTGGIHNISAAYGGDLENGTLTSNSKAITVIASTTTTVGFSVNPAAVGQNIVFTAGVTGAGVAPTGSIAFMDGSTTLATVSLTNGQATYSTSYAALGTHAITATYSGDIYHAVSIGSGTLAVTNTSISSMSASTATAVQGAGVALSASVSGNNPSGTFTFMDGSTSLGSASITAGQGSLNTTFATVGNHSLTVVYNGDANNAVSISPAVNINIVAPTNIPTISANPAQVTQIVTLGVTIVGNNPSGTVIFMDGSSTLGSITLVNGQGSLSTSFSTVGSHSLTSVYSGDSNNPATTSVPLVVNVIAAQAPPVVSLITPVAGAVYVQPPATINLQATATSPGSIAKIDFYYQNASGGGPVLLSTDTSSPYTYSWTNVPAGTYKLTAVGTDNVGFSTTSSVTSVRVNSPPTVVITSPIDGTTYTAPGPAITITAVVTDSDGTVKNVMLGAQTPTESGGINTPSSPPYSVTWSSVPAGDYTFVAQAEDNDGAWTFSAPVTIHSVASAACQSVTPVSGTFTAHTTGSVWGNSWDGYTVNSDIGAALVQMGIPAGTNLYVTIRALGALSSYSGTTANGITSSNAAQTCGMMLSVTPSIVSVQRNPSPMVAGAPFSVTATAVPNTSTVSYSCNAPLGVSAYRDSGAGGSGQAFTGTAEAAWVGNPSTCVWTALGSNGSSNSAPYTETVSTIAPGTEPLVLTLTANGVAGNSTVQAQSIPTEEEGRPAASVTFNGGASEVGATITSLQWTTGTGAPATATLPMTLVVSSGFTYTLIATDSFGQTASTSVTITVATPGAPTASLGTSTPNLSVANGATAQATFSAGATATSGTVSSLTLMQSTAGGGYSAVPGAVTTGGTTASMSQSYTVNLAAGSYNFELVATDNQGNTGMSAPVAVTVIASASQSITFAPLEDQVLGTAPFTISASASSGLGVAFKSQTTGVCTVTGNTVTLVTAGTCTIAADQAGNNTSISAAPEVTQSFTVQQNTQNSASFSSQSVPSQMRAGQPYNVSVTMVNTGSNTWLAGGSIKLGSEKPQDNRTWGTNARVELPNDVPAGQSVVISFTVTAPSTPGTYDFQWEMVDENVGWFGSPTTDVLVTVVAGAGPSVSLSATPSDSRMSGSTPVTVNFTGTGTETGVNVAKLELFEDSGTGFGSSAIQTTPGSAGSVNFSTTASLVAGTYRFKLRATDANSVETDSTPVIVTVAGSSMLGQVNGIQTSPGQSGSSGTVLVTGWACESGNSNPLTYSVYVNAPKSLGGTLLVTGSANVSGQADDASVQSACGTTGSSHDFSADLSSYSIEYGGSPIYVESEDASGTMIVLPCVDNTCVLPGSTRIGFTVPANGDQYNGDPASVFLSATVTGGTPPYNAINFQIDGQSVPAVATSNPNIFTLSTPLAPGSHSAIAQLQEGGITLYSSAVSFSVVPGSVAPIALNNTSGTVALPYILSATVAAGLPNTTGSTVAFYVNNSTITTAASPAYSDDAGTWTQEWNGAAAGAYTVSARLFDVNGNLLAQSATVNLTVGGGSGTAGVSAAIGAAAQTIAITPKFESNPDAGSLPGSVTVGNNGAATYSIPIAVPPGTNGLTPTVSLNYSSLAGNGIAGFGWSLGGSSSIHRCVRTVAQDSYAGPINLAASDALCIDGTRLLLVSGTYGTTNATYRTEIDNFAKITQIAGATINNAIQPAFMVQAKNGQTMYYGFDPISSAGDSTAQAVGKVDQNRNPVSTAPALYWNLAKVVDLAGNVIQYHYTQDVTGGTGEMRLNNISYGNNSGGTAAQYNNIIFGYECRNGTATANCTGNSTPSGDADIEYVAGARSDLRHRLTTISTYTDTGGSMTGGTLVQTTTLTYQLSGTSQRSLLYTAQVCAPGGSANCLPATTFTWGTGSAVNTSAAANSFVATALPGGLSANWGAWTNQYKVNGQSVINGPGIDYQQRVASLTAGDFVGDGKQRILVADNGEGAAAGTPAGTPGWHIFTLNETGTDFDHYDLAYGNSASFGNSNATPSQLDFATNATTLDANGPPGPTLVGDFDGDGKADVVFISQTNPNSPSYNPAAISLYVCLSQMSGSASGGFDCQSFTAPFNMTYPLGGACYEDVSVGTYLNPQSCPQAPQLQAMFLNTQANGRADLVLWNPVDVLGITSLRCSFQPGPAGAKWSINCSNYAGFNEALNGALRTPAFNLISPYEVSQYWPTSEKFGTNAPGMTAPASLSSFWSNNTSVVAATAQRSYVGDYLGTGQSGFIAQGGTWSSNGLCYSDLTAWVANAAPMNFTVNGYNNNANPATPNSITLPGLSTNTVELGSSVVNYGGFSLLAGEQISFTTSAIAGVSASYPVGTSPSPTTGVPCLPTQAVSNQFVWSNPGSAATVSTVVTRYLVSESKGTELGGSSLGDLNGDGYTDYLMTFEGHAEICYSLGADGFDCHLMEDQTLPSNWSRPTLTLPANAANSGINTNLAFNVPIGPTVTFDNSNLVPSSSLGQGVYSVLTIGHASDTNLTEVIYRRSDGGSSPTVLAGGNQYWVCVIRDGNKQCTPWTGPTMRPAISGNDGENAGGGGYPIPGVIYNAGVTGIQWPTAGGLPGDYSGHGKTEILWYCNSNCVAGEVQGWSLYTPNMEGANDRLVAVKNGNSHITMIDYARMGDATAGVYTQNPSDGTIYSYPLKSVMDGGRMLVSAVHVDKGDGSAVVADMLTTTYRYEGLATDSTGRGEQGFERITVTNPLMTVHSTQYAQGFPYTGMELGHSITSSLGVLLEQTSNALAVLNNSFGQLPGSAAAGTAYTAPGSAPLAPYQAQAGYDTAVYPYVQSGGQLVHADLDGSPLPLTSQSIPATVSVSGSVFGTVNSLSGSPGLDAWGNVVQSIVTTQGVASATLASQSGTYTSVTTNLYGNHPADSVRLIGQLVASQVTKSGPSQVTMTRTKRYDYYGQGSAPALSCGAIGATGTSGSNITGLLKDDIVEPCSGDPSLPLQTNYGRDSFGNVATTTQVWYDTSQAGNPLATRTIKSVQYDPQGRFVQSITNALGQSESALFDHGTGAQNQHTDLNGLITTWVNDGFGRVLSEQRPDGTQTNTYRKQCQGTDTCPNVQGVTSQSVLVTDHVLSANTATRIAVPSLVYTDTVGHALRQQSWGFAGVEIDTDQTYDTYGRPWQTFQPNYVSDKQYLNNTKEYDEFNRVIHIFAPDETGISQLTQTVYNGLSSTVTNPALQSKTELKDALGQLTESIQVINSTNLVTLFARDAFGNLTQTTDPQGNVVTITYDNLGRKTQLQDPDLGLITYGIDARGIQWQQVSPIERHGNQVTLMYHDALDRLTIRLEPDLASYWVYDNQAGPTACGSGNGMSCGQLVEAYAWNGTPSSTDQPSVSTGGTKDYDRLETYDSLGRPSTTQTILYGVTSVTSTTQYDAFDRSSTLTRQLSGSSIAAKTYSQYYNSYGYLAQIARSIGGGTATILWESKRQDAGERVLDAALGNTLAISREYNSNTERLDDGLLVTSGSTMVFHENYQYDVLGNVSNRVQEWGDASNSNYSEGFTYDGLNRLSTSQVFGQAQQVFTYDNIGNITSKTGVGTNGNAIYTYGTSGSNIAGPHAVTNIPGIGSFSYDSDGNISGGAGRSYGAWTSFDMPGLITETASGNSSKFAYGPEHQRIKQTRNDMALYDIDGLEIDIPTGQTMAQATVKTYWPAGLGVEIDAPGTATVQRWNHVDRLGSITAVTNETGGFAGTAGNLAEMPYDAWGNRRSLSSTPVTASVTNYVEPVDNKGFTGQEELDQLGLVHLNGRVYDPFIGRFLSADPLIQDPTHSQSYNRYTYVWNNPTNETDPTGFAKTSDQMHDAQGWTTIYSAGGEDAYPALIITGLVGADALIYSDGHASTGTFTPGVNGAAGNFNVSQDESTSVVNMALRNAAVSYFIAATENGGVRSSNSANTFGPQESWRTHDFEYYSDIAPNAISQARKKDSLFGWYEQQNWDNSQSAIPNGYFGYGHPTQEQMLVVLQKDSDGTFLYLTGWKPLSNPEHNGNFDSVKFPSPQEFEKRYLPKGYHLFMNEHSHPFPWGCTFCDYGMGPSAADINMAKAYTNYFQSGYYIIQAKPSMMSNQSQPEYWYYGPKVENEQAPHND